jgi:thioredoxin 1
MTIEITTDRFEEEVLKSDKPVLVDFWAVWCGPCRMVAPIVDELDKEMPDKLKVFKVNVDKEGQIAQNYSIRNIPTLLLFKNGEVVEKIVGALAKPMLLKKIEPHL